MVRFIGEHFVFSRGGSACASDAGFFRSRRDKSDSRFRLTSTRQVGAEGVNNSFFI
jgi:hypothetical protein